MNQIKVFKADLHIHTLCSDGKYSPVEMVQKAAAYGLDCISITDHDTMEAYETALPEAIRLGVELIYGVEISAHLEGKEVHLLCYGIEPDQPQWRKMLLDHQQCRYDRAKRIVDNLKQEQVNLNWDQIVKDYKTQVITRPTIAQVLVEQGYAKNTQDAFSRYIGNTCSAYVAHHPISVKEVIHLAHLCGGLVIVAHPGNSFTTDELMTMVREGIDGIECVHPSHTDFLQRKYRQLAKDHDLLMTAGSDFHGYRYQDYNYIGRIKCDFATISELKKRFQSNRSAFVTTES
jgi:predicted metal-dependent phosphoesterase TrpH